MIYKSPQISWLTIVPSSKMPFHTKKLFFSHMVQRQNSKKLIIHCCRRIMLSDFRIIVKESKHHAVISNQCAQVAQTGALSCCASEC